MMASEQEKDIKVFQQEVDGAAAPELRQFAAEVLPKVKDHLAMARAAKQATGKPGGARGESAKP